MTTTLSRESAERMATFASSFSALDNVPGTRPFDVDALVEWIEDGSVHPTQDASAAAGFLIWLYSRRKPKHFPEYAPSKNVQKWADSFELLFMVHPEVSLDTRSHFAAWFLFPWFPEAST